MKINSSEKGWLMQFGLVRRNLINVRHFTPVQWYCWTTAHFDFDRLKCMGSFSFGININWEGWQRWWLAVLVEWKKTRWYRIRLSSTGAGAQSPNEKKFDVVFILVRAASVDFLVPSSASVVTEILVSVETILGIMSVPFVLMMGKWWEIMFN